MVDVADSSSFAISRVVVLTQYNIRERRDSKVDLKKQYKFYLKSKDIALVKNKTLRKEEKGITRGSCN